MNDRLKCKPKSIQVVGEEKIIMIWTGQRFLRYDANKETNINKGLNSTSSKLKT